MDNSSSNTPMYDATRMEFEDINKQIDDIENTISKAIENAELIMFLIDGSDGVGKEDIELFEKTSQKLADTIEELCDEICLTNGNDIPLVIHNVVELDNTLFKNAYSLRNQYKNIYGAIWTDKGLIYVAQMNDKGELELL